MPGTAEQGIVEVELLWFFDYFVGGQTEREREKEREEREQESSEFCTVL